MARGSKSQIGTTRTSANGYHYIRTNEGWRFQHHVIAEKRLGRKIQTYEMVRFKDGNKDNLDPDNIEVVIKGKSSLRTRKATLEYRIDELKAELDYVNEQLNKP